MLITQIEELQNRLKQYIITKMIDNPNIYWPEQCKFCLRALNTTYCDKNKAFMKKLESMYHEYLGTVEFECDYFSVDKKKLEESIREKGGCDFSNK